MFGSEMPLPLLVVATIALLALLLSLWQLLLIKGLGRDLYKVRLELAEKKIANSVDPPTSFATNLDHAEREQQKEIPTPRSSAEKYRYVAALADQGVDAAGIATALHLAPAEVTQLLQLARLKQ